MSARADPRTGLGRGRDALVRAAAPAALGLAAWMLGFPSSVIVLGGVAIVLFGIGIVAPGWTRSLDRAVAMLARRASSSVSLALATIAWVVIVVPVWCASAATRYSPFDPGAPSGSSRWLPATRTTREQPSLPRRGFALEPPMNRSMRWRGHLRVLPLALLALGTIGAVLAAESEVRHAAEPEQAHLLAADDETPIDPAAFSAEPWAAALLDSDAMTWLPDPDVGWVNGDSTSPFINVADGSRDTLKTTDPQLAVWMFGGSTTFGFGQRDDHTIPSELVRQAAAEGIGLEVVNHGVAAHVNWQQTLLFERRLASQPAPDLVLFLDGANDRALATERVQYGQLDPADRVFRAVSAEDRDRLRRRAVAERYEPPDLPDRMITALMASQYQDGLTRARWAAAERGVVVEHFWQPEICDPPADRPGVRSTRRLLQLSNEACAHDRELVDRALSRLDRRPTELRDVFDTVDQPVFFDYNHTNEAGARLIATAILDQIRPTLIDLSEGR